MKLTVLACVQPLLVPGSSLKLVLNSCLFQVSTTVQSSPVALRATLGLRSYRFKRLPCRDRHFCFFFLVICAPTCASFQHGAELCRHLSRLGEAAAARIDPSGFTGSSCSCACLSLSVCAFHRKAKPDRA